MHKLTTTNPKKNPDRRRKRQAYPPMAPGDRVLIERPECGINIEHPGVAAKAKRPRRVLRGVFVFSRLPHPLSRNQYDKISPRIVAVPA